MSLTLEIVGRQSQGLGAARTKTFGQDGGTIGRSLEADWALPDRQRFLSSKHASIDFRSGSYYIVDTSKNGVYINGAENPVGHGKPQRLFSGDQVRIGEYEMKVSIENVDDTRETLLSTSHVDPVDAKQRVEAPDPTTCDLVEAHAITGVGIEMFIEDDEADLLKPLYDKFRTGQSSAQHEALTLVSDVPPAASIDRINPTAKVQITAPRQASTAGPALTAGPASTARPALAQASDENPTPARASANGVRLESFFRGAGIAAPRLSAKQSEELLSQLGQVMRELIVGVIDCLHLRALQKAQLKQSNTIIQPRENNRLKFSANFEEGFSRLFLDDSEQYTSPVESVRGAFSDIKEHQRALLKSTRAALDEYLDRLDPQQLELRACNGRTGSLINAANKLRYWDLYKEVYSILANRPLDELPQPFLDALASAYQRQIGQADKKVSSPARQEAG
jgi:type VI secretion system protein